ncbi:SMP-30/gluconolactonase/LRE family protein [Planctomicrobium sp. SH664]|uniref:SMP-30/gluconolactonase/LRE family protein n=1 Tax=Planctomicrobium sp. SH664 TaxID=3448125 RepID=UPI003F5BEEF1
MVRSTAVALLTAFIVSLGVAQAQEFPLTPDSLPQADVPQGKIEGPFTWTSKIFPGTVRKYWIYVPAQYDAAKPTCLFILQDGLGLANGWKAVPALDNLIHKKEIPVQLGLFIEPGVLPAPNEIAQPRFNRSFEYDALGPRYADFLVKEILPEVKKSYNISDDPNDRAIGGNSSGGICAFNAAWERPDQFRRVITGVGTYVGLRGADQLSTLVRKTEPKPIRVYLQDGSNDLNIYAGDWFNANQGMLSALKFAGYEVEHAWGEGGHNARHIASVLPDALRFVWKDYPQPIARPINKNQRVDILIPGEDWVEVSSGHQFTEGPAVNELGEVFFSDVGAGSIYKIGLDGKVSLFVANSPKVNGLMFGPDGKLYACQHGARKIVRYAPDATMETVVSDVGSNDLVILADGTGYFTDYGNSQIWRFTPSGEKSVVDKGIKAPNGIIVSPDQTLLTVADSNGRFTYSFQIQPDGKLAYKQQYGWLHEPDQLGVSGADGMTVDTMGRLYVATLLGVQVLDQPGRVNVILSKPQTAMVSNVVFGGPELDTLYVTSRDKVFKRKINAKGVFPFRAPVAPPKPGL